MKIKFNFSPEDILEKKFNISLRGYDPKEVDYFLDLIIKDYEAFKLEIEYYKDLCKSFKKKNDILLKQNEIFKRHINVLKNQVKSLEEKGLGNIDIIKRINDLEEKNKK